MSDAPVSASSTPDLSPANAKAEIKNTRQAPATPSFNGQQAARNEFSNRGQQGRACIQSSPVANHRQILGHHHNPPAMQNFRPTQALDQPLVLWASATHASWLWASATTGRTRIAAQPPGPIPLSNPPRPDPTAGRPSRAPAGYSLRVVRAGAA